MDDTRADPFDRIPDDPTADLDRAEQSLSVRIERRTYDKPVTVIEGFDPGAVDVGEVASELKRAVGAGGTVEVQGNHEERVRDLLADRGFAID